MDCTGHADVMGAVLQNHISTIQTRNISGLRMQKKRNETTWDERDVGKAQKMGK